MTTRLYRMGPRHDGSKIPLSPSEEAARIRRAARALKDKVQLKDLMRRGFTSTEIDKARRLLESKSLGA